MRRNAVSWAALLLAIAALIGSRSYTKPLPAAQDVPVEGQKVAQALSDAFGAVAEYVGPSVVQINVEKKLNVGRLGRGGDNGRNPRSSPLPQDGQLPKELEDMLKKFFGPDFDKRPQNFRFEREQYVDSGTGSGFVMDDKGHILTNNHVVEGADKIVVTFHDGVQVPAKVVGTHPESDVAVIKVEQTDYRPVKIGSSSNLKVGQWVLALGSPFGLDHTVTAGIISAKERQDVGINRFESFVQTDAAINPGNSGGPLVDLYGRVIGINSAIATASRSNSGVGFAIPIDMAVRLAEKLIKSGKISPALIGITIEPLTSGLAKQFDLDSKTKGLLVTDVGSDTPAEKAGLKQGDVVLSYDGQPVTNRQTLQYLVSTSDIGQSYKLVYMRDGQKHETAVAPATADSVVSRMPQEGSGASGESAAKVEKTELADFGLSVSPMSAELAEKYGWDKDAKGVVVTEVTSDGPASEKGLEAGDRITRVVKDRKILPVNSVKDLEDTAKSATALAVQVEDVRKQAPPAFMTIDRKKAE